jgi:glycosyltransferase involved in cell wall biosynthesis
MSGGGAERALLLILKNIDRKKYEPVLLLLNRSGELLKEVPPDVLVHELGKSSRWEAFALLKRIREAVRRIEPDVIVSLLTYSNSLLLAAKTIYRIAQPVIVVEQNHLSSTLKYLSFPMLRGMAVRLLYRHADSVVGSSNGCIDDLIYRFGIPARIAQCIYNPADVAYCVRRASESIEFPAIMGNGKPTVLAAGRLTKQKDFPTLLLAFETLLQSCEANLVILGEGELRNQLEDFCQKLNIREHVCFAGFQSNPYPFFKRADCFVLSSIYEGFGMVIVEAMALKVPVISTDCPSGPGELIENNVSGILTPMRDSETLAVKMKEVLHNEPLRKKIVENACKGIDRFSQDKCVYSYERLIDSLLK